MINTKTELLGLLGNPLEHSFSPVMHNKSYEKNNLNYLYLPLEIEEGSIKDVLMGIKHMKFIGFNVTIPYKLKIMEFLDEIDPLAKKIGSVNTVKITNGKLIGFNTDGTGFVKSLERDSKIDVNENKFLLLGAGGASRSIAMTLADKGAEQIFIANRTVKKAKELSEEINNKVRRCCSYVDINNTENMKKTSNTVDIIINTTSLGMYPNIEGCPLDINLLLKKHLVTDIVYNPVKTKLLREAENKGCRIQSGLGMLINQAAEAFEIWTEKKAPIKDMKDVINDIMA
ncbi:MAG: shikimate dehydrogenase [Bacillota bacterium]|nr:shikimate dehydrogenase [Bacillota bacterium]